MKFTIEMIKTLKNDPEIRSSFPKFVQELKKIGVNKYEYLVESGVTKYYDEHENSIFSEDDIKINFINNVSSKEKLEKAIKIHQNGETDFQTFLKQAGEAGIIRWECDLAGMNVIYFDRNSNVIIQEKIPDNN